MDSAWSKGEIWSGEPTRTRAVSRLPPLAKTRLGFSGSETPVKVQGSKGYLRRGYAVADHPGGGRVRTSSLNASGELLDHNGTTHVA